MRILDQVPMQQVVAHQRPNRPNYPPADSVLETLNDPQWSDRTRSRCPK